MFASIRELIRLGRPLFLVGGVVLYALGAVIALYLGAELDWVRLAWGQIAVSTIQLMTHYANDYFDVTADRANRTPTPWSGGSRVLADGTLPPWVARTAALVLAAMGLLEIAVIGSMLDAGPLAVVLLLSMLALSWAYSAPPFRLHSRGLGELTVVVVVSGLTPLLGFYLQAGALDPVPFQVVLPICLFQLAMMLAIEFPDAESDAEVGKRNLVVRFGAARCSRLYVYSIALGYAVLPVLVLFGFPVVVGGAVAVTAPLGAWLIRRAHEGAWRHPAEQSSFAFWTIALLTGAELAELAGFAWLMLVVTPA